MQEVTKLMEEYFRTVTPEQFEKDLIDAGILDCPDEFEFMVQGDPIFFQGQLSISNKLKITEDVIKSQITNTQPVTINMTEVYEPYMSESQYVIPRRVA